MKSIKLMVAAMFAMVALSASLAYAEPTEHKAPKSQEWKEKMEAKKQELYKDLNLTEEQKKALEENKNKNRELKKSSFQAMKGKMEEMRKELQNPTLNMEKINQIQSELKASQAQMLDQRLQGILEIRKILTAEQFTKFSAKMEEHKGHGQRKWVGQHDHQGSEGPQDAPEPSESQEPEGN